MGLAANQARLLTLTSRMADLELRCQTLSNQKIMMSALAGNVSLKYNEMLTAANNIGAQVITTYDTITSTDTYDTNTLKLKQNDYYVAFNYNTLKNMGYDIAPKGTTGIQNQSSLSDAWTMPTTIEEFGQLMLARGCANWATDQTVNMTKYIDDNGAIVEAGNANSPQYWASKFAKNASVASNAGYTDKVEFDQAKLEALLGPMSGGGGDANVGTTSTYSYSSNDYVENAKNDANILVEGLMNGSIGIYKDGQEVNLADVGISEQKDTMSSSSTQQIATQSLDYSARDAARQAAQSYYERENNKLSRQEQMLDLMSKAADTEYSAVTTEYESVKSLVGENAEKGFSLFG